MRKKKKEQREDFIKIHAIAAGFNFNLKRIQLR